jgi:hypothetical protein
MSTETKNKMSREEAVNFTKGFVEKLTPQRAAQISANDETKLDLDQVMTWAWSQGVGGWYYDDECKEFCTEVITRAIILKTAQYYESLSQN